MPTEGETLQRKIVVPVSILTPRYQIWPASGEDSGRVQNARHSWPRPANRYCSEYRVGGKIIVALIGRQKHAVRPVLVARLTTGANP
jgi:hypothetical protein